jgi:hypothetical protein
LADIRFEPFCSTCHRKFGCPPVLAWKNHGPTAAAGVGSGNGAGTSSCVLRAATLPRRESGVRWMSLAASCRASPASCRVLLTSPA